jgi:hypothetical protein
VTKLKKTIPQVKDLGGKDLNGLLPSEWNWGARYTAPGGWVAALKLHVKTKVTAPSQKLKFGFQGTRNYASARFIFRASDSFVLYMHEVQVSIHRLGVTNWDLLVFFPEPTKVLHQCISSWRNHSLFFIFLSSS